jgi:hypothetical protein
MNIAAVIDVAPGRAALERATETQTLLLEHLGQELGSIRLAAPRLLKFACRGAIAEKPDLLVVAGGPRAARRAGQIAYTHRLPVLFLPGYRTPRWASQLWGSLSLEEMVAALAQDRLTPVHLPAGIAGGEIFFAEAICGFLPQVRQLGSDLARAETIAAAARLIAGAAGAFGLAIGRGIRISCHGASRCASAIVISTQGAARHAPNAAVARLGSFACDAWSKGAGSVARAAWRAALGGDWQSAQQPERFSCTKLAIEAGSTTWLLLDEEPIAFQGRVELRYLPKALQTFAFAVGEMHSRSAAQTQFRAVPHESREPGAPLSRSNPGYGQQSERRGWKPACAK